MKLRAFVILLLCFVPVFIAAEQSGNIKISDIFSPSEIELLRKGGIITYARMEGKGEASAGGMKASFPRGAGRIYDDPAGYSVASVEKAFFKGPPSDYAAIFEKVTDYPALKGMRYYSISEGRAIPLILESWISGNSSLKKDRETRFSSSYFTIKDNRLGTIPFRGEAWGSGGAVYVSSICSGHVSRFGMKVFQPGDYRVYKFIIYDRGGGGWFYCSVQLMRVRSGIMKSLDLLRPENICNRLRGETVHILGLLGHDRSGELAAFR